MGRSPGWLPTTRVVGCTRRRPATCWPFSAPWKLSQWRSQQSGDRMVGGGLRLASQWARALPGSSASSLCQCRSAGWWRYCSAWVWAQCFPLVFCSSLTAPTVPGKRPRWQARRSSWPTSGRQAVPLCSGLSGTVLVITRLDGSSSSHARPAWLQSPFCGETVRFELNAVCGTLKSDAKPAFHFRVTGHLGPTV